MADTELSGSNMEEISLNGQKSIETGLLLRLPKLRFGILFEDLPQHILKRDVIDFCFKPVQILDSLLHQFVQHRFGAIHLKQSVVQKNPTPPPVLETSPVFLPALGRVLPQDWRFLGEIEEKRQNRMMLPFLCICGMKESLVSGQTRKNCWM